MTNKAQDVLNQALGLSPIERAELVEKLLASFEFPDRDSIDAAWAKEAEDRLDAFDRGEVGATPETEVFKRVEDGENP